MRRFMFHALLTLLSVAVLALVLAGSSRSLVRAPASAFVCDTTYVSQTDDGFTVFPFDYADWALGPLPPQPYEWHPLPQLNDWILNGGPKPAKVTSDVVNPDGTPNLPEAPEWFPNALSDAYWFSDGDGVEHDVTHASQVFAYTDILPIAEPDLVAQLVLTPDDQAILDEFPDRYVRREEAMADLRTIVAENFSHDTENLQCALDAAESRAIVRLTPGTYEFGRPIIIRRPITLIGSTTLEGEPSTTIETVPGGFNNAPPPFEDRPEIFILEGAEDIRIADMTLAVKGTRDSGERGILRDSFAGIYITGEHNGLPDRATSEGGASIERVDFVGESGSEFLNGTNLATGVTIAGEAIGEHDRFGTSWVEYFKPFSGGFAISNSRFENLAYGLQTFWLTDSSLVVGGEASEGNSFGPCSASAISLIDLSNSEVRVSQNETLDCAGVSVVQGLEGLLGFDFGPTGILPESLEIEVEGNIFEQSPSAGFAGIQIWGLAGAAGSSRLEGVIEDNEFASAGHVLPWGPIFTYGASDVVIRDNTFSGAGEFAVYIGPSGTPDSDVKLEDNSFGDWAAGLGAIWLGPGTTDNVVEEDEPSTLTDQVLDEGTDNTIIGAERVAGPAPDVTDEVERRLATLGKMR